MDLSLNSLLTCFCFGAVSSFEVAFLMFRDSSFSALSLSTGLVGRWSSNLGLRGSARKSWKAQGFKDDEVGSGTKL